MSEMKFPITSFDLKSCFSKEAFVVKTCQQINKDMAGLVEHPKEFDIHLDGDVLHQIVTVLAENLKSMDANKVQQFIYRVDLKEQEFKSNLQRQMGLEDLAFKVLRREAQKIFLRIKYSQQ